MEAPPLTKIDIRMGASWLIYQTLEFTVSTYQSKSWETLLNTDRMVTPISVRSYTCSLTLLRKVRVLKVWWHVVTGKFKVLYQYMLLLQKKKKQYWIVAHVCMNHFSFRNIIRVPAERKQQSFVFT